MGSNGECGPAVAPAVQVISLYQKQPKIHPRTVRGWFQSWRWAFVWLTQVLFYGTAWLPWNGRQAVLFDLGARRFYIFDLVLYPQDFIYLAAMLIISAYSLFLFTAMAGRLWCGCAWPQTVYTEIFMWLERTVEGNRNVRIRRDKGPWTGDKAWRKLLKHGLWWTLAMWTGFTFVGYFTPIRELWAEAFTLDFGPWEWFWVVFYGMATYGNAGFLREQVCKYMCPYARFQSAMFDPDTLVITYDEKRGEPRGLRGRSDDPASRSPGACIDCDLCVQVCPTGIDIRQGLQYECIGCAACIDVCNGVMDKMRYPRGLIRYDTQRHLASPTGASIAQRLLRPRILVYGFILVLICAAVAVSLFNRLPFKVDVMRDRNALAQLGPEGQVQNVYRLQLMNASESPQRFRFEAAGLTGIHLTEARTEDVGMAQARWIHLRLEVSASDASGLRPGSHPIQIIVTAEDARNGHDLGHVSEKSTFILPR